MSTDAEQPSVPARVAEVGEPPRPGPAPIHVGNQTNSQASSPASPGAIEGDDPRIARAVAGERDALESLCRDLLPRLRNLARFLLRGDGEVDDASQEALLAVVRGLHGFRGESRLTTWADRIGARTILAAARRARTHRARQLQFGQAALPPEGAPSHEEQYRARRLLAELLDQLPDAQRQAVVMHHVVGCSLPELADVLEIPFETARSRLRLGMAKLRQGYGPRDTAASTGDDEGARDE